jgi:hypothetical protein
MAARIAPELLWMSRQRSPFVRHLDRARVPQLIGLDALN